MALLEEEEEQLTSQKRQKRTSKWVEAEISGHGQKQSSSGESERRLNFKGQSGKPLNFKGQSLRSQNWRSQDWRGRVRMRQSRRQPSHIHGVESEDRASRRPEATSPLQTAQGKSEIEQQNSSLHQEEIQPEPEKQESSNQPVESSSPQPRPKFKGRAESNTKLTMDHKGFRNSLY